MLRKLLEMLGLRKRRTRLSPRDNGNINHATQLIRNATHPTVGNLGAGKLQRIPAERRVHGMWCIRSPWHNGAWIGGYYNISKDIPVTCANPDDINDYDDRVEQHEIAHRIEYKLRISPPWHTPAWRRLFLHWYSLPALSVMAGEEEVCDKQHSLPYCDCGDVVEVDFVL